MKGQTLARKGSEGKYPEKQGDWILELVQMSVRLPKVCKAEEAVQMQGRDLGAGVRAVLLLNPTEKGCYEPQQPLP